MDELQFGNLLRMRWWAYSTILRWSKASGGRSSTGNQAASGRDGDDAALRIALEAAEEVELFEVYLIDAGCLTELAYRRGAGVEARWPAFDEFIWP